MFFFSLIVFLGEWRELCWLKFVKKDVNRGKKIKYEIQCIEATEFEHSMNYQKINKLPSVNCLNDYILDEFNLFIFLQDLLYRILNDYKNKNKLTRFFVIWNLYNFF